MEETERLMRKLYELYVIEDRELRDGYVATPYEQLSDSRKEFLEDETARLIDESRRQR